MKIELDKEGLIDLINGTSPNYNLFENPTIKKCGWYDGSYGRWHWTESELLELTEQEIYNLYILCKESFKHLS